MNSTTIVQKLRSYCDVPRDDRMSYGLYVSHHHKNPTQRYFLDER
jgi:hypothetical protein